MKAIEITVFGRVQGVGYRYFSIGAARRHGITGWTKNMPDGTVRIHAVGADSALAGFLEELRQGPPMSRVSDVRTEPLEGVGEFLGFEMRM